MVKIALIALGLVALASGVQAADCSHDDKALLALDYAAFDQDMHGGWRPIAAVKGCEPVAADLIKAWRGAHPALDPDDLATLDWHEGQMRAVFGDYDGAVPLIAVSLGNPDEAMQHYTAATIAFLKRDKSALVAARAALAATPKPEGWDQAAADYKARYGEAPTWPDNLDVVDGLIACFDRPYAEAYGACRPKP